jgi:hypothetical protein
MIAEKSMAAGILEELLFPFAVMINPLKTTKSKLISRKFFGKV